MGKVQILAVLTIDGCLSSELYGKAHKDLRLDRCGLDEIRKNALYRVTPDYSISMLTLETPCGLILYVGGEKLQPIAVISQMFYKDSEIQRITGYDCLNLYVFRS